MSITESNKTLDSIQLDLARSVPRDPDGDPFDPLAIRRLATHAATWITDHLSQVDDVLPTSTYMEANPTPPSGDLKAGRSGVKAPLHWIPLWAMRGVARVFDYGARRYAPGNWLKAARETTRDALDDYLSAQLRHVADAQEPDGLNDDQLLADLSRPDPESGLPHIDHMICGLIMLRGIMIKRGILPADPGRGKEPVKAALR